jgi:hypothetical protein
MDPGTMASLGEPNQPRMGNVPASVEVFDIPTRQRNFVPLNQLLKGTQDWFGQVSVK